MTVLKFYLVIGTLICLWFVMATANGCRVPESSGGGSYGGGMGRGIGGSWGGGK